MREHVPRAPRTLILRSGRQVSWHLPPVGSCGVVRDESLGVSVLFESSTTAAGTPRLEFTAVDDRELPRLAREYAAAATRTARIAAGLARLVAGMPGFGPQRTPRPPTMEEVRCPTPSCPSTPYTARPQT